MSMQPEEFERLVSRLEGEAEASPRAYRLRVAGLGALAYLYVFGVLAGAVALIGLLAAAGFATDRLHGGLIKLVAKGGWAIGGLVLAVGRSLFVKLDAPSGLRLERADHPALFAAIDAVRAQVGAPAPHAVLLDDQFNAGIVQRPRLGLVGGTKNTLIIGLPLMRALSEERFRAVLAHEFGHLAGAHGWWGDFIYRSRMRWSAVLAQMEERDHWASFVFRPFFRWYAPFFNAYSFVQARAQEYEADRSAAEVEGAHVVGDALIDLDLKGSELEGHYWADIRRRMDSMPEPDVRPFAAMRFTGVDGDTSRRWLGEALSRETTVADTHPCLRDRLAALGLEPRVPEPGGEDAARVLLGDALPALAARFDERWLEWVGPRWREHFEGLQARRERLDELAAKKGPGERSVDEDWDYACLLEELSGEAAALEAYRALHSRDPGHVNADFAMGRLLLGRDDPTGLAHIERTIAATDTAILPGSQHAIAFLRRAGRDTEVQGWIERAQAHQRKLDEAERERSTVWIDDRYDAHGLPGEAIEPLVQRLREMEDVAAAWLIRRRLQHDPDDVLLTLVVRRVATWTDWLSSAGKKARDLELQQRLDGLPVPGGSLLVVTNHRPRKHRAVLEGVEGSQIPM